MKEISQNKIKELVKRHILFYEAGTLVDRNGESVGYRRTKHHNVIQDRFADWVFKPRKEFNGGKRNQAITQRDPR